MHEIHSDTDNFYRCTSAFCTKHGSAVFHVKMFHPCLKIFWNNNWIFSQVIYAVKFHHLEKTPCCCQYSTLFHLSCSFQNLVCCSFCSFYSWCDHLRTLFHPALNSDFTTWSDHWLSTCWDFQPGFSSDFWTAISSSSWDFCTFYPLWRFCSHATLAVLGSVIMEQLARWQK